LQATARNKSRKPILLVYDGHGSHETSELCHLA
jgi:serine/threonine protein phosphatase PrpC